MLVLLSLDEKDLRVGAVAKLLDFLEVSEVGDNGAIHVKRLWLTHLLTRAVYADFTRASYEFMPFLLGGNLVALPDDADSVLFVWGRLLLRGVVIPARLVLTARW